MRAESVGPAHRRWSRTRRPRRPLEHLRALAERLNRSTELQPVVEAALVHAMEYLRLEAGWIVLLDEEGQFALAAAGGLPPALEADGRAALAWSPCACQRLLLAGELHQAVNILTCERLARLREALQGERPAVVLRQTGGLRYHATVPLRVPERVLGLMNLARRGDQPLRAEELTVLNVMADTVGAAIHRALLHQQVRASRVEEQAALLWLTTALLPVHEPEEVLRLAAESARRALRSDFAGVFLPVPEDRLRLVVARGTGDTELRGLEVAIGREAAAGWAFATRTAALVPDAALERRFAIPEAILARGLRSTLAVPMIVNDRALGVLTVKSRRPGAFSDEHIPLAQSLANMTATALERARLTSETERRLGELSSLHRVSMTLRGASTMSEMTSLLVGEAARVAGADAAMLCLVDEARSRCTVVGVAGLPPEAVGRSHGIEEGVVGLVLRTGSPYRSTALASDLTATYRDLLVGLGPGLCVPMRTTAGQAVGTLLAARRAPVQGEALPFDPDAERLLATVAEIAANALQRIRNHEELEQAYVEAVLALANAMDARDTYTADHSQRLAQWAVAVARALGLSEEDVQGVHSGALLHDIGKLGVPDEILLKPGPLTEEEWTIIRRHPAEGARILAPVRRLHPVVPIVRHHQERWDGTGYPAGLAGEAIPLGARILAVVDAYVAMTDDRPYRAARSHDDAVAELRRCAGTQFDPRIVAVFCKLLGRGEGSGRAWRPLPGTDPA